MNGIEPYALPIVLDKHTQEVWKIAFTPDNKWFVTTSHDSDMWVWELTDTGPADAPLFLPDHEDAIWDVALSPDSRWIVTGSADSTARLWDLNSLPVEPPDNQVSEGQPSINGDWLGTMLASTNFGDLVIPIALHFETINNSLRGELEFNEPVSPIITPYFPQNPVPLEGPTFDPISGDVHVEIKGEGTTSAVLEGNLDGAGKSISGPFKVLGALISINGTFELRLDVASGSP